MTRSLFFNSIALALLLLLGTIPVLLPKTFLGPSPFLSSVNYACIGLLLAGACFGVFVSRRLLQESDSLKHYVILYSLVALALLQAYLHYLFVDKQFYMNNPFLNELWQFHHLRKVIELSPEVIPHSYRFLPFGLISFISWLTDNFFFAKTFYRVFFYFCTLLTFFRLFRTWLDSNAALVATLIPVILFPVSIAFFAGQPTDPLSHFSFALTMLFLVQRRFPEFAMWCLAGLFAKESLLVMPLCWLICARDIPLRARAIQTGALLACAFIALFSVRLYVESGSFQYSAISGIGVDHILQNLKTSYWPLQILFQIGLLLPFWWISRRSLPPDVHGMLFVLLPAITVSNLMFSWMHEARNFVPCTFLLALACVLAFTGKSLEKTHSAS